MQKIKIASYKKHSGTKLDQYQPMVLEILSFSCLYAILSNNPWWPFQIGNLHKFEIVPFKKIKTASYKKRSGTKFDQFQQMVLEIGIFVFMLVLVMAPGSHLDRSIFI